MKELAIAIAFVLCFLCDVLPAQTDTLFYTLEQAKEYALTHNKQLLNVREDLHLYDEQYKETRAQGLPQASGTLDYMTNFNYEVEFSFGMSEGTGMPEIDEDLLDAGDYEILNLLNSLFAPSEPATILMEDQANAQFMVSQLIFSGQYWVGLEIAKIYQEFTQTQVRKTEEDVAEQVMHTCYLILASEQSLNILNKNLKNLKQALEHTRNMYQAGVLEKSDVDQLRMNVSQLENSREVTKRGLKLSYNMLRIQLGLETNRPVKIQETLSGLIEEPGEGLLIRDLEFQKNRSYQLLDIREHLSEQQVKLEKWAYAPTLIGFYSYTEKILTTDFDLSPRNAAGFTLSVPIYSGGSKNARKHMAQIELDKTRRNKSLFEDQLTFQENQLKYDLRSALENFETQSENVAVAKSVYSTYVNKYRQGLVSSLELTQANNQYLQAENNYISSVLRVLQARLSLKKLFNML